MNGHERTSRSLHPWIAVGQHQVRFGVQPAGMDWPDFFALVEEVEALGFYEHRAPEAWLEALAPIGTDWQKPFLEIAPWLIVVFKRDYEETEDGRRTKNRMW